jgi:Tfp pilus assembly protein FimT
MKKKRFKSQSGVSLIEVLIILSVLAVLTTIAITQFRNSKTNLQRQNIAREFKIYLERARFDSVKRRATSANDMSRIVMNSSSSFTAIIDLNQNGTILNSDGTFEAGDQRAIDFTNRSNTQIVISDSLNYPVTVRFDQRGQIISTDNSNNNVNPVFTICSTGNCSGSSQNSQNSTVISVSPTGTVSVLNPDASASPLPTPSITNSSTNTSPKINCLVFVANSNTSTCSSN